MWRFALCQADCFLGRSCRFSCDRLVNGHGLRALGDADHRGQIGILPGNRHLAGQIVLAEGLNRSSGQTVIGSENGSDVALRRINRLQRKKVGFRRQPISGVAIGDHLDFAAINLWLQNFQLSVMQNFGASIVWRTRDQYIVPFGRMFD